MIQRIAAVFSICLHQLVILASPSKSYNCKSNLLAWCSRSALASKNPDAKIFQLFIFIPSACYFNSFLNCLPSPAFSTGFFSFPHFASSASHNSCISVAASASRTWNIQKSLRCSLFSFICGVLFCFVLHSINLLTSASFQIFSSSRIFLGK